MGYYFNGELQPWGNPIALLKFKGLSFFAELRYGLHAYFATKRDNWKPLEKYDAATWIKNGLVKKLFPSFSQNFYL
jgi:protoporphyrinogen oxidase